MRVWSRPAKLIQQSEDQLSLIESRLGELEAQEKHLREIAGGSGMARFRPCWRPCSAWAAIRRR